MGLTVHYQLSALQLDAVAAEEAKQASGKKRGRTWREKHADEMI